MAQASFSLGSRVQLSNGLAMPCIQLGVYLTSGKETADAVRWALEAGYRAVDSAQMYHNEKEAGQSIKDFLTGPGNKEGLGRKDIHFTSKIARNSEYERARSSISRSVKTSGLDYIDLFLLHSPYGGKEMRLESWRAIEDAIDAGEVRMGGVSNFGIKHVQELLDSKPRHRPVVNQIEVHPFNTRTELAGYCQDCDIIVQAYAPLARALRMRHPTILALSGEYDCEPAQLMVRWSLQHGYVPLPKSTKRERIVSNAQVGGFQISEDDMRTMDELDEYLVTDWDPVDAD